MKDQRQKRRATLAYESLPPKSYLLHPFIAVEPQSIQPIKPCQPGPPRHVFTTEKYPIKLGTGSDK